jgi:hypothetical protein
MPGSLSESDILIVQQTISKPRFGRYVTASSGDLKRGILLYNWNSQLSSAFIHCLHLFEVVLRNRISIAIAAVYGEDWQYSTAFVGSLPQGYTGSYSFRDDLESSRNKIIREIQRDNKNLVGPIKAPNGKVVAELKFMFWVGMLTSRFDAAIWNSYLTLSFPNLVITSIRSDRRTIYEKADSIRRLRNRIAHHEPIFHVGVSNEYANIAQIVGYSCLLTAGILDRTENVRKLIANCP